VSVFSVGFLKLATVYAVPAGCYLGEGNGVNTYTQTQCPKEGVARAAGQFQTCFVVLLSGAVEERNCNSLENPDNKVPESQTFESGITTTIDDPIETDCNDAPLTRQNCGIINLLVIGINVLSAIAGIVIVASLMIAGFTYMTAQDNAGQTQKAKSRIVQTLIALALFIFMYGFLNFLVPGGVLP